MRCTVSEQNSAWNLASPLPACDLPGSFILEDAISHNFLLFVVIKLSVSEFFPGSGLLANFIQFLGTVRHLVNGHIGVAGELCQSRLSFAAHFSKQFLTFFVLSHGFFLGLLFINLLLTLVLEEACLKSIE